MLRTREERRAELDQARQRAPEVQSEDEVASHGRWVSQLEAMDASHTRGEELSLAGSRADAVSWSMIEQVAHHAVSQARGEQHAASSSDDDTAPRRDPAVDDNQTWDTENSDADPSQMPEGEIGPWTPLRRRAMGLTPRVRSRSTSPPWM